MWARRVTRRVLLCDKGFHLFCLRPILISAPKGCWFCPSCSKQKVPKSFPLIQTKIIDFFRIQRSTESTQKISQDIQKKRKRSSSLVMSKKRRKLLPFNPSEDRERRLEQMRSLATALTAAGTEFSNELSYRPSMAPRSANKSALEKGGMQNRENDDGDSMMKLLHAANPSQSLVICPDKRGNVSRFINGINNHTQEGKRKQNLKCVRYDVDGECRVLLIASRDISKGERLYHDYNGHEHEYPTEHFV
ncbi:hypothetical protein SADUNF_Sadunf15G0008900 [Salix dunnii]|uniref:SET domain-containing protein n=1 Tax=Salix dunnii TaxID=1413687 RepID=A0A835JFB1_9ROSI|nr:hypothetical protein SADUNF_Sadunf15G0008900 [Salix dunnii]